MKRLKSHPGGGENLSLSQHTGHSVSFNQMVQNAPPQQSPNWKFIVKLQQVKLSDSVLKHCC